MMELEAAGLLMPLLQRDHVTLVEHIEHILLNL
jgi:hypothetical protein